MQVIQGLSPMITCQPERTPALHDLTVFVIKPNGSVGYEYQIGLLPRSELEEVARKAALDDQVGTGEEITPWTLLAPVARLEEEPRQRSSDRKHFLPGCDDRRRHPAAHARSPDSDHGLRGPGPRLC